MTSLRAAFALCRVEWRSVLRHRGRAWLVVWLVAVPVAALVGASTLHRITEPTLAERGRAVLGSASVRIDVARDASLDALRAALPAGARVLELGFTRARMPTGDDAHVLGLPPDALGPDGLARGAWRITAGRAPSQPGEAALAPVLLAALACAPGDDVLLGGRSARVVGTVVAPESLDQPLALVSLASLSPDARRAFLVDGDAEACAAAARAGRAAGAHVRTPADIAGPDGFEALVVFVVGGFGLFEAALVIGAAFAVGLRRRQREFGLLAAQGATAGMLRAAMLCTTCALAGLGALLGTALGTGCARALHPFLDGWNARENGPFAWSASDVLAACALGVLAAVIAAWPSTVRVTRLGLRDVLALRRPESGTSRGALRVGIGLCAAGIALVTGGPHLAPDAAGAFVVSGSVLGLAGLVASTPWWLGLLARAAAPLPPAWRLAARDAGRFRTRHGPAVAAVLAAMALSVLLSALLASVEARMDALGRASEAPDRLLPRVALMLSLLTGFIVLGIATALTSAESAADGRTLHALGAPPALLRRHAAARAAWLAFVGCALAVPAGILPALGVLALAHDDVGLTLTLPWDEFALAAFALPAGIYCATWLQAAWRGRRTMHAIRPSSTQAPVRDARSSLPWALLFAVGALASGARGSPSEETPAPSIVWEDFVGEAADGTPLPGRLGRIRVPENREHPSGDTIELAFVHFESSRADKGPPIVYLEGGPGGSGVDGSAWAATFPLVDLLAYGDVIGLDQRGTGLSRPSLTEGPEFSYALPLDRPLDRAALVSAYSAAVARCVSHWTAEGVDLAA